MKQLVLPLKLAPAFEEKDFILSPSNEEAYLWLMKWPDWPKHCLTLYGDEGCGKTHLSYIWQRKTNANYLSSQSFGETPIEKLIEEHNFVILDDAHLIENEEKFFHFYNHVLSSKGGLLLLSQTPPAHWNKSLPDLQSRLNVIPAIKIHTPDEDLLFHVIQKRFADLQLKVEDEVIQFLLKHIERSFASVHSWIEILNTAALIHKRSITIPLVRELLVKEEGVEKGLQLDPPTNPNPSNDQGEIDSQ